MDIFKGMEVIIRGHPSMPISNLLKQCIFQKPRHFKISKNNLKSDLNKCSCVIYRQTSVGIQALMNSIPIIHVNINSPLSCDPLCSYKGEYKWDVNDSKELAIALKKIKKLGERKNISLSSNDSIILQNYFRNVTDSRLKIFLK